jgi:hypothetical protein
MPARLLIIAACLAASVAAHATEITRVWSEWRTDESFVRLSELFGGSENSGSEIYLRSKPGTRDGLYFLVRLADASAIDGTFELSVIKPGAIEPAVFKFPASVKSGSSVFQLGLTGGEWTDVETDPVAWRIALVDASGTEVVAKESFLWSPPK